MWLYGVLWRNVPAFGPDWRGPLLGHTPAGFDHIEVARKYVTTQIQPESPLEYKIVRRWVSAWEDVPA